MNVLTLPNRWDEWVEGAAREQLEREILPEFLRRQRWFAGKARVLREVRIARMTAPGALPGSLVLAVLEVSFEDGGRDRYFLPLSVSEGPEAEVRGQEPRWSVTAIQTPEGNGVLHDALADPEGCRALLEWLSKGEEIEAGDATIRGYALEALGELRGASDEVLPVRVGSAEQSNSAVIFGDRLILKLFRRLEPGVNPDFEIGRYLTEKTSFDRIPLTAGALELMEGGKPTTLAILQGLVANQGTGWEHALQQLGPFYRELRDSREPAPVDERSILELAEAQAPASAEERFGPALEDARTLGRRTAEMHLALGSETDEPAFKPEPFSRERYKGLARDVREQVERSLSVLKAGLGRLSGEALDEARRVLERGTQALERLEELAEREPGVDAIRVHGDYHLGQVLRVQDDYVILDFEGEPAKPLTKRVEKQLPLKDVVGMLRSFDYAAFAGLFAAAEQDAGMVAGLSEWAKAWRNWTSAAFLRAYLDTAQGARFLPEAEEDLALLLDVFTIDKALYELLYELNSRPDWVRIPLQGVLEILDGRGETRDRTSG